MLFVTRAATIENRKSRKPSPDLVLLRLQALTSCYISLVPLKSRGQMSEVKRSAELG
jgi:hypothetical protein